MKNNTVVVASDMNYLWGVYLLIASMRCYGMDEPVLVYASNFTERAKKALEALQGVSIVDTPRKTRSQTCTKPDAMLLTETEYATWVDCDGFFTGNCSDLLIPDAPELFHIRLRGKVENELVYPGYGGEIPAHILECWQRDVGERREARYQAAFTANFIALHKSNRPFLERWRAQMQKVLPEGDSGVIDHRSEAYFHTDESVLTSLLCFSENPPQITPSYHMDKDPRRLYIHFGFNPKPWNGWAPESLRHFDAYMKIVDFVLEKHYPLPGPLPFFLQKKNKNWCRILRFPLMAVWKLKRLRKRLSVIYQKQKQAATQAH